MLVFTGVQSIAKGILPGSRFVLVVVYHRGSPICIAEGGGPFY